MATSRTLEFLDQLHPSMGRDAAMMEHRALIDALKLARSYVSEWAAGGNEHARRDLPKINAALRRAGVA